MYLDTKSLVTTGWGFLIDPMREAMGLPWEKSDGCEASAADIAREWLSVKKRIDLAQKGGEAFKAVTTLRLSEAAIEKVGADRLAEDERVLTYQFPDYEGYPAAVQLGLLSMAWARGPAGFKLAYPKFTACILAKDWAGAANECFMHGCSAERNTQTKACFTLAAAGVPDDQV
jgi:GH24 family phage-related lysozyme (muramidase)